MGKKQRFWLVLTMLVLVSVQAISQQVATQAFTEYELSDSPKTFVGPHLKIKGVFLEAQSDSSNAWEKYASRYVMDSLVYGKAWFEYLKWGRFNGYDSVGPSINLENIVDWVLVGIIPLHDVSKVWLRAGLLTKDGEVIDSYSGKSLHYSGVPDASYYVIVHHRTSISVLSSTPMYIEGTNEYTVYFDSPDDVWGINPLKFAHGKWCLYTGDSNADNFSGLLDWVMIFNHQGRIGYCYEDLDNSGRVNDIDISYNTDNWYVGFQAPWVKKRRIDFGPDNFPFQSPFRREEIPYTLKAKNFKISDSILSNSVISHSLDFDVTIKAEEDVFVIGGCEFIVKFDPKFLNNRTGRVRINNPLLNYSRAWLFGNEIRFVLLPIDEKDSIDIETLICSITLSIDSSDFNGTGDFRWKNQNTNITIQRNDSLIFITDTTNHYIENNLMGISQQSEIPFGYFLYQNYPNPFNPITTITYSIPVKGDVAITMYDISGKEVMTLVNEQQTAGLHSVKLNASNLSSGTYFYKLSAGDFTETKKMVLIK